MTLPEPLLDLRRNEIVLRVQNDPRSVGDLVLGVDRDAALDAIDWGQADFDKPAGMLTAEDRVLLYAYFNQLGHFEELSEAFRQMFSHSRPRDPFIVIDLGCGPFTAGLAFAGQLVAFKTWFDDCVDLAPAVAWSAAALCGLSHGYKRLDTRFRGKDDQREVVAVQALRMSSGGLGVNWPRVSEDPPNWQRDAERYVLSWGGAERLPASKRMHAANGTPPI